MRPNNKRHRKVEPHLTQAITRPGSTPCRGIEVVDGVMYSYFLDDKGKVRAMRMDEFLARSGAPVRA